MLSFQGKCFLLLNVSNELSFMALKPVVAWKHLIIFWAYYWEYFQSTPLLRFALFIISRRTLWWAACYVFNSANHPNPTRNIQEKFAGTLNSYSVHQLQPNRDLPPLSKNMCFLSFYLFSFTLLELKEDFCCLQMF